jgi:hypothetical protein
MKHLKLVWLCLVSMLTAGMALAGNASAEPFWLVCLPLNGNPTKYDSNQCNKASATGSWESVGLGVTTEKSDTVRLLAFSLRLTDKGTGVEVECPDPGTEGWGLIENWVEGTIKVAKVKEPKVNCKVLKGALAGCVETKNLEEIEGVNLPWKTEIFETENKFLTKISGKTEAGKRPGWKVRCGGITDTCEEHENKPEFAELENATTNNILLIKARFEQKVKADCSIGGKEQGEVKGLIAILLWNGNGLSIH